MKIKTITKAHALILMLCFFLASYESAHATDIYVSPRGDDTNAGTQQAPLRSLSAAKSAAARIAGKEPVTVHVGDGVYYLPETLVFKATESGTKENPVTYRAVNEGGAVLSGGTALELNWEPYKDGIYQAKTPADLTFDQLFINGKLQRMARYPNYDASKDRIPFRSGARDIYAPERAKRWADPAGGYIHSWDTSGIGGHHRLITGKNSNDKVSFTKNWNTNTPMGYHPFYQIVENIFEELDVAEEWYHNSKTNTLYYKPTADVDLNTATVEVARLRHVVELQGSETSPVKHITFQGFVVRHTARTFMDTTEPLLASFWKIYRGGAFVLTGTENIQVLDTEFDHVGGNAIFVNHYNRNVSLRGCHIHHTGASAICFVGDSKSAGDAKIERGLHYNWRVAESPDFAKLFENGPLTNNYPADSTVEDCLIHDIGRTEFQTAGVHISMSQGITVRACSIYDVTTNAVNVNEGTWGGHLIEHCDAFRSGDATFQFGEKLPFFDAMVTTTVRNNRISSGTTRNSRALFLSATHKYDIYNNLVLTGLVRVCSGSHRRLWNNIVVNRGMVLGGLAEDRENKIFSNILMSQHLLMTLYKPGGNGDEFQTTTQSQHNVDRNLINADSADLIIPGHGQREDRFIEKEKFGFDENSILGDPMFVDAANGDFRVKEGSPAFKIGFENFAMDQFGVKKPSLKAIAKTPKMPQ